MPKKCQKKVKNPQKLHDQKVKCKNCRSGDNKKLDGVWGVGEGHALGWGVVGNALIGGVKLRQNLKKVKKACGKA